MYHFDRALGVNSGAARINSKPIRLALPWMRGGCKMRLQSLFCPNCIKAGVLHMDLQSNHASRQRSQINIFLPANRLTDAVSGHRMRSAKRFAKVIEHLDRGVASCFTRHIEKQLFGAKFERFGDHVSALAAGIQRDEAIHLQRRFARSRLPNTCGRDCRGAWPWGLAGLWSQRAP